MNEQKKRNKEHKATQPIVQRMVREEKMKHIGQKFREVIETTWSSESGRFITRSLGT